MQKFLHILFSCWMVFANSCALKDIAVQQLNGATTFQQVHHPFGHPISTVQSSMEQCTVCVESDTDQFVTTAEASIKLLPNLPNLNFLFAFFLLPFWIGKSIKQNFGEDEFSVAHSSKLPLYLQFKKIQLYA